MDWPQLIKDIVACGWTQVQIAERVGSTQTTISELHVGRTKEPGYSLGRALEELHAQVVSEKKAAA